MLSIAGFAYSGVALSLKISPPDIVVFSVPFLIGGLVLATLEVVKRLFGSFQIGATVTDQNEALQFRIRHLLIATTAIAVAIAIIQRTGIVLEHFNFINASPIIIMAVAVAYIVVATLMGVWVFMGQACPQRFIGVFPLLVVLIPLASFLGIRHWPIVWTIVFSGVTFAIFLYLGLLRKDGLRFVKRGF